MPESAQWAMVVLFGISVVIAWWERIARSGAETRPRLPAKAVRHQRDALRTEIRTWESARSEQSILWHDWGLLDKVTISSMAEERGWHYRGQDMLAAGYPLFFTRDEGAAGYLEREQARRRTLLRTGRRSS